MYRFIRSIPAINLNRSNSKFTFFRVFLNDYGSYCGFLLIASRHLCQQGGVGAPIRFYHANYFDLYVNFENAFASIEESCLSKFTVALQPASVPSL